MADTSNSSTPSPTPAKPAPANIVVKPQELDWSVAVAHLKNVEETMLALYAGKEGVNPYIWIAKHLTPLKTAAAVTTSRSAALYASIMQLEAEVPAVNMTGETGILQVKPTVMVPTHVQQQVK